MEFTGERFTSSIGGSIALEHFHRYFFVLHHFELKGKIVLDIACGEGYGSDLLSKKAKMVYGVDVSKEAISYATKKYFKNNISFIEGSAHKLPIVDNTIDIVVSFETIEHHDKHDEMFMEFKRVLRGGGILVISSPDKAYYEKYYPNHKNEFHIKELYKDELQGLIEKNFKTKRSFGQAKVFGSFIFSEEGDSFYHKPLLFEPSKNEPEMVEPEFNLYVVSDSIIDLPDSVTLCSFSKVEDLYVVNQNLSQIKIKHERLLKEIYSSKTYRLGLLLASPFKFLRFIAKKFLDIRKT